MNGLEAFNELVATLDLKEKIAENKIHRSWQGCIEAIERELKVNQILKEKTIDIKRVKSCIDANWTLQEIIDEHNELNSNKVTEEEITLIVEWLKGE